VRALRGEDAAVTAGGAATPAGPGFEALLDAVSRRRSAPAVLEDGGTDETARLVARVPQPRLRLEIPEHLEAQAKFLNVSGQLAVTAAAEAGVAAGIASSGVPEEERGLFLAQADFEEAGCTAFRPAVVAATEDLTKPLDVETMNVAGARAISPFYLLDTLVNNAFSFTAALHGLRGSNTSISGWSATGAEVVSLAARALVRGDARLVVALAAGRVSGRVVRFEMRAHGVLPDGRPGAEGAVALVLEPLQAARDRGARPMAVVAGHGGSSCGGREDALEAAAAEAAREALAEAEVPASDLGLVVADAKSAPVVQALAALGVPAGVPVLDPRDATGEMAPASAAAEILLAAASTAGGRRPRLALSAAYGTARATVLAPV
jgi:3-oxoacyl-[acyl-carrier-protein] synthase II